MASVGRPFLMPVLLLLPDMMCVVVLAAVQITVSSRFQKKLY